MFEYLKLGPSEKIDDLPVITNNIVLPFEKLSWPDFERFCFQLGSKMMDCLDSSYTYGRNGQKQEGIDLYFHKDNHNIVWQIKRYQQFSVADVTNAVKTFLKGTWASNAKEFVLCVSNYVDDVSVVNEIDKQTKILEKKKISFSVLNSEKLTLYTKKFPDLIDTFFGRSWKEALIGNASDKNSLSENKKYWCTDTGVKLESNQIYQHGDFEFKVEDNTYFINEKLPDGSDTHVRLDTKTGGVCIDKFPYPLNEYRIDVPQNMIVRIEEDTVIIKDKKYNRKIYLLKWGGSAYFYFDENGLADLEINCKFIIDHLGKMIHILDISKDAIKL